MTRSEAILAREHDLPPKWDGVEVEWRGWEPPLQPTFRPHVPPCCCEQCGSDKHPALNQGLMAARPGGARLLRLVAFRCADCGVDVIRETSRRQRFGDSPEWWVLDESDYGAEGSTSPEGRA